MWKTLPVGAMAHLALYVVFCAKVPPQTPPCRAGKVLVGEIKAKIANFGVNSSRPKRPCPSVTPQPPQQIRQHDQIHHQQADAQPVQAARNLVERRSRWSP